MPNPKSEFERDVEKELGRPLSEVERIFLGMGRLPGEYERDVSGEDRPDTVRDAAAMIDDAQEAGLWSGELRVRTPRDDGGKADGRWDLLRDLGRAAGQEVDSPLIAETLTRQTALNPGSVVGTSRVTVTFDSRLGMRGLFREVKKLWPHLRAAGWVRPARPLGDKKLALVRHVCLETALEMTMRERMEAWNAKPRIPSAWHYSSLAAFHSDFRRGELALTGRKYGLDYFYDSEARWLWEQDDRREVLAAVEAGEISAKAFARYMKRLSAGFSSGLQDSTRDAMQRVRTEGGGTDG